MYKSELLDRVPQELKHLFVTQTIFLKHKYPAVQNVTIDRLAYKYLHTESLADWMQWKYDHRYLWGLL